MLIVRPAAPEDTAACAGIVQGLPEFFTPDVPQQISRDLTCFRAWVITDDEDVRGFAIADQRSAQAAEIIWCAIAAEHRGRGIGTALVNHLLDTLHADGVRLVEVKTLDRSAHYDPYISTCAFWERRGFVQIDTIDPLPGWQPGNPSAVYVAALDQTRPESTLPASNQ